MALEGASKQLLKGICLDLKPVILRPVVFNPVCRSDIENDSPYETDHQVCRPHDFQLSPYFADCSLDRPVVINRDGITTPYCNGNRRTLSSPELLPWTQFQKERHFFRIDDRASVEQSRSNGRLI